MQYKMLLKYRRFWLFLLTLEVAVIILFSLLALPPLPDMEFRFMDKIQHFGAYLVLGATAFLAFHRPRLWFRQALGVIMGCLLFGGAIEILQNFTGRSMEVMDLAADLSGAILGAGGISLWLYTRKLKEDHP